MRKELLDRMEELTDEKYDWLESQQKKANESGDNFNIDRESDLWYTRKIAELQLILEQIQSSGNCV
jgi:hypothetical protein